ncbi:MAG: hypothetical protein ABI175_07510 [Polyangiales bacterium]
MDIFVFSHQELPWVLRALRTIAEANDVLTEAERALLAAVARLHGESLDIDALPIADEAEVARHVQEPHRRKRLVQLALVTSLIEGEPADATVRAVQTLATALDIDEAGIRVLRDVAAGHLRLARFDMIRRVRHFLTRDGGGLAGVWRLAAPLLGLGQDAALSAKYRALAQAAPGTLGREWHDHLTTHGFALPGEKGSVGEAMIFHDVGHLLSGYDVDPQGEIQQAAFQAGFVRNDGFLFLLFGILQFHVGVKVTPVAEPEIGYFDVDKVMRAVARGAACKVDLSSSKEFDFWAVAHEPIEALRARWTVPSL